jgi:hypothetical protein
MHDAGVAHLKKLCRAEGGAKFFWVFRVKNHDFTPKNLIFSNFRGGGAPWIRPCDVPSLLTTLQTIMLHKSPDFRHLSGQSLHLMLDVRSESLHSHYNAQFYSSHASIFVFRDAILQI